MFLHKNLLKFVLASLLFFSCGAAQASEIDPTHRVRVAEAFNSPPSVLLLMQINDAFLGISDAPPVWQTLTASDAGGRAELEKASAMASYDMLITGDESYLRALERLGVLRLARPIYSEKLILVGPTEKQAAMRDMGVKKAMGEISSGGMLFFSQIGNDWASSVEKKLWAEAGVAKPFDNKNYVESDRDDLSLLIQAEDEGGFLLTGEASFAQYMGMVRDEPLLAKFGDTGGDRKTYAALVVNAGFRKERTAAAERYIEWLSGDSGKKTVESFELGGISPFKAVK